jgi:hypothetical protein
VAINTSKLVFAQSAIQFGGYIVDGNGFRPDPELMRAIRELPRPLSITDIRSFFFTVPAGLSFFRPAVSSLGPAFPAPKNWIGIEVDDAL